MCQVQVFPSGGGAQVLNSWQAAVGRMTTMSVLYWTFLWPLKQAIKELESPGKAVLRHLKVKQHKKNNTISVHEGLEKWTYSLARIHVAAWKIRIERVTWRLMAGTHSDTQTWQRRRSTMREEQSRETLNTQPQDELHWIGHQGKIHH